MFRKPEEKVDVLKYDEVEQTESPDTNKSSLDDTSSDLVQETAMSDYVTPNAVLPVESCGNSHITSDVEDHSIEGTVLEVTELIIFMRLIFVFDVISWVMSCRFISHIY